MPLCFGTGIIEGGRGGINCRETVILIHSTISYVNILEFDYQVLVYNSLIHIAQYYPTSFKL